MSVHLNSEKCFNLSELIACDIGNLYLNENYADVVFVVEDQRIPGHRAILASRSKYFRDLLFSGLGQPYTQEVTLDLELDKLKRIFKYIYTGKVSVGNDAEVIDLLSIAKQFGLANLLIFVISYLLENVTMENVCTLVERARSFKMLNLMNACYDFMDRNAVALLQHKTFLKLTKDTLMELLERDTFAPPEIKIFVALTEWLKQAPAEHKSVVLSKIRFVLMSHMELQTIVYPTGLLDIEQMRAMEINQKSANKMPFRHVRLLDINVVEKALGVVVIRGFECVSGLTFIFHNQNDCIILMLHGIYMINHLSFHLLNGICSYCVEFSTDMINWKMTVDYKSAHCRDTQYLYFPECPARFIRICGTSSSLDAKFSICYLRGSLVTHIPQVIDGICVPKLRVGQSISDNLLQHKIGHGSIQFHLSQPYLIDSVFLHLYDHRRSYSFFILTSVDGNAWELAADRRNESVRLRQVISFSRRCVSYIQIIGTKTSGRDDMFMLRDFYCPAGNL